MSLPCLLSWINIKVFLVHSYFQSQCSALTSEYQIESGVLRRAAWEAVRMTLFITLSRYRFQTTITSAFTTSHLKPDNGTATQISNCLPCPSPHKLFLNLLKCEAHRGYESWDWNCYEETFTGWNFSLPGTNKQLSIGCSPHGVSAHIMQSGAEWMCQLPIRPH